MGSDRRVQYSSRHQHRAAQGSTSSSRGGPARSTTGATGGRSVERPLPPTPIPEGIVLIEYGGNDGDDSQQRIPQTPTEPREPPRAQVPFMGSQFKTYTSGLNPEEAAHGAKMRASVVPPREARFTTVIPNPTPFELSTRESMRPTQYINPAPPVQAAQSSSRRPAARESAVSQLTSPIPVDRQYQVSPEPSRPGSNTYEMQPVGQPQGQSSRGHERGCRCGCVIL